ncbi:hypothetical protein [Bacillus sp. Marseille-P3661]|uniref:hypothetical protein n=1 Tax=Bacillus sp. Marseille-P3661 TaxID=1936234 RepID=UPI0015E15E55|nr:hypothetical protein [Bacillus sp. Marseille-P3661]
MKRKRRLKPNGKPLHHADEEETYYENQGQSSSSDRSRHPNRNQDGITHKERESKYRFG